MRGPTTCLSNGPLGRHRLGRLVFIDKLGELVEHGGVVFVLVGSDLDRQGTILKGDFNIHITDRTSARCEPRDDFSELDSAIRYTRKVEVGRCHVIISWQVYR